MLCPAVTFEWKSDGDFRAKHQIERNEPTDLSHTANRSCRTRQIPAEMYENKNTRSVRTADSGGRVGRRRVCVFFAKKRSGKKFDSKK